MKNEKNIKKNYLVFSSIILLFVIPFILAKIFYAHKNWLPEHKVNHGSLISPLIALDQISLEPQSTSHHWILMLIHNGLCDSTCQKELHDMQQIQKALGKDADRMQRALAATQPLDIPFQQELSISKTEVFQLNPALLKQRINNLETWYVIDPLGNIILSYPSNIDPENILDDIKHLMNVSMIG